MNGNHHPHENGADVNDDAIPPLNAVAAPPPGDAVHGVVVPHLNGEAGPQGIAIAQFNNEFALEQLNGIPIEQLNGVVVPPQLNGAAVPPPQNNNAVADALQNGAAAAAAAGLNGSHISSSDDDGPPPGLHGPQGPPVPSIWADLPLNTRNHPLTQKLYSYLEEWNIVAAVLEMNEPIHRDFIRNDSIYLIPLICKFVTPEIAKSGPHVIKCCEDLLLVCAQLGAAKENLISILEQIEILKKPSLMQAFLPALTAILMRIKDKSKSVSWSWALATICCHTNAMSTQENSGLEGNEKLTLELKEEVSEVLEILKSIIQFVKPLVDFCTVPLETVSERPNPPTTPPRRGSDEYEWMKRREVLIKFMLMLCQHPLASFTTSPELKDSKGIFHLATSQKHKSKRKPDDDLSKDVIYPRAFDIANYITRYITQLSGDCYGNIVNGDIDLNRELDAPEEAITSVGVGTYLYLLLGEDMHKCRLPCVYTPVHLLVTSSRHVITLLSSPKEMITFKGVVLLKKLTENVPNECLSRFQLDNPQIQSLWDPLTRVVVYNPVKDTRVVGFDAFVNLVNLFDLEAKYSLYKYLLHTVNHSGILGWVIGEIKSTCLNVFSQFESIPHDDLHSHVRYYKGDRIPDLVRHLFKLKNGVETDLLEISDELISSMNLALILVSRSPLESVQQLKPQITKWADEIKEAHDLTKAHYELKLKQLINGEDQQQTQGGDEIDITVSGVKLPQMDPEGKKGIIQAAILTLDQIDFNLAGLKNRLDKNRSPAPATQC